MIKKNLKKLIALCLVLILNVNSFAAIVADNDGTSFVTKYEFDNLKYNFSQQVNDYNKSIDGKIDGAIAEYLSGISTTPIEVKKILYPCDADESIWCMKKNIADDKINFSYDYPKYEYLGEYDLAVANSNKWFDWSYVISKFSYAGSTTGEKRIILTSKDNFSSDFVWDRYVEKVNTSIKCFAFTNTFSSGPWASKFDVTYRDAVPNISASDYYTDFNTITDFIYFVIFFKYRADRSYQEHNNQIKGDVLCSNAVEVTKGEHTRGTTYKNAIVYESGTDRYVCMDDPHWVCVDCSLSDVKKQNEFSALLTCNYSLFYDENYVVQRSAWDSFTRAQTKTGKMPIFGMYKDPKDMATVKNKNYEISYNNGAGKLTDITLINGIPLLYGEKDRRIEWKPIMEDTRANYNFYLSLTKFTGVPNPATCLDVSVDGATATKSPVVKSGQTLSFVMPSDGVVWLKWSDSTGKGGGALEIGQCAEYKSIDQS